MEESQTSVCLDSTSDYFPSFRGKSGKTGFLEESPPFSQPLDSISESTPRKDQDGLNFIDLEKGNTENNLRENIFKKKIDILEVALIDLRIEIDSLREKLKKSESSEAQLKVFITNLLDMNEKLNQKVAALEKKEGEPTSLNTNIENKEDELIKLRKILRETSEENDVLQSQKINLAQALDAIQKREVIKDKTIDFYKNRIKLYQFKLQDVPKSEKQEIKNLEEYVMKLLGENSKLNHALEKSEKESKKWKDKYFEFEKEKELLNKMEEMDLEMANEQMRGKKNENIAKPVPVFDSLWTCKPKEK